ncbi:hypothetical protein O0I10_009854 [Lichtheimia ornata]|uniref:Swi5-dependent recombination DNA repair protein 1 homolog n=1 Tax=Lichtheimia ornata TaxID=688661 RepID=A0AAD7XVH4_9FUNG|nr:uncharacterized protein O0I10_009854 [Lichtheimia ornata]KAJ8654548.1 hypothetical protein O0I10_009854 [Lichtheimia ornata]
MNHQTSTTTLGSIKRPKLTQEEQALQKEWKKYDDMIQQINQAKCYLDKDGPEELEQLITKWRAIAQHVAEELLAVFNEQKELFTMETSWDYWGDEESIFMDESTDDLDEREKPEEEEDPMVQMLTRLKVDPEVIHYSAETNSFYD